MTLMDYESSQILRYDSKDHLSVSSSIPPKQILYIKTSYKTVFTDPSCLTLVPKKDCLGPTVFSHT